MYNLLGKATLLLILLTCSTVVESAAEVASELEFDSEVEDGEMIDDILRAEMEAAMDTMAEQGIPEDEDTEELQELEDLIDEEIAEDEGFDLEEEDAFQRESLINALNSELEIDEEELSRKKRSDETLMLENLLRDFLRQHDMRFVAIQPEKCSAFAQPTAHGNVTCGSKKTMFGVIEWCHVGCTGGYSLKKTRPQYELCGKATKYRWTYELRGLNHGTESCVSGGSTTASNATSTACSTKECLATAAYYMNKIDFSVNPCDNFYEYACGRWVKETPIPSSKSSFQTYTIIRDRVAKNLADLLDAPSTDKECAAVKKAKTIYKSCINTVLIDELDSKPLLNFLTDELTWPILDRNWDASTFNFEKTVATLRGRYNNQVLLTIIVRKYNGNHVLQSWKGKMALPHSYYFKERYGDRLEEYYSLFRDIAIMLGADPRTADDDVEEVKKFERRIAYHKYHDWDYLAVKTLDEMMIEIPGINWIHLFKNMIVSHPINGSTKVQVWNVIYLENLIRIISETDKRVVQNYMIWRIVKHRIKSLSQRFQDRYLKYERALLGKRTLPTRSYSCSHNLLFTMKGPTGKLFIDKYFSEGKKKAAIELFNFIRKGFIHLLETEVNWMDATTKAYAKKKAKAIKANIGYNKELYKDVAFLDKEYAELDVSLCDYFGNTLRTLTVVSQNKFALLGEPINTTLDKFQQRPTMVNAFYNPTKNAITLPAGEMQYPFYWGDKFPRMFQYGAIGTILGHELTHAFDNEGRQYDLYGNKRNWWSASSLAQFNKRISCMSKQYSNYFWKQAGENLNGQNSLGENIADNGGIRESFAGYHFWLQSKNLTGEYLEPTTGLTNDQMFFVGFANVRCAKYTTAGAIAEIASDVHSPGRYRVIGSLQNFDKFSKAFNCPLGSFMNPVKKCIVW